VDGNSFVSSSSAEIGRFGVSAGARPEISFTLSFASAASAASAGVCRSFGKHEDAVNDFATAADLIEEALPNGKQHLLQGSGYALEAWRRRSIGQKPANPSRRPALQPSIGPLCGIQACDK
jgi:hypothetical protein